MLRVGDRVVFRVEKGDDYYPNDGDPARGMEGEVIGRERITMFEERVGLVIRPAGVYEVDGPVIVRWDNGKTTQPNGWYTKLIDATEDERRWAEYRAKVKASDWKVVDAEYENRVFKSGLPTTKGWEGDFVTVTRKDRFGDTYTDFGIIEGIEYYTMHREATTEGRYRYRIVDENKEPIGGSSYTCDAEMEIIERGNVYKYFNGEQVQFADLHEEAAFYMRLGKAKSIRNPANGLYSWTLKEAIAAIRAGTADSLRMENIPFSSKSKHDLQVFEDRDLGKRLQEATLKGFEGVDEAELDAMDEKRKEAERTGF
jgi:hypothetical protein